MYKYVKILVKDPYNNRDIILNVTKKQKGLFLLADLFFLPGGLLRKKLSSYIFDEVYTVLSAIALITYANPLSERKEIIKNNNKKSGVYRWINQVNG